MRKSLAETIRSSYRISDLSSELIDELDDDDEEDYTSDSDSELVNDAEYRSFVEKYGHLDFHLLKFLP